jgi:hypothetical protein
MEKGAEGSLLCRRGYLSKAYLNKSLLFFGKQEALSPTTSSNVDGVLEFSALTAQASCVNEYMRIE